MNKYGQIDNFTLGNSANTVVTYDINGFVDKKETKIGSTWIQNWDYDFEANHGNLEKRKGINPAGSFLEETFTYDNLNRLLTYNVGTNSLSISYDQSGKGNISTKSGIGTYKYASTLAHRLDSITNLSGYESGLPDQNITYTKFNKISTLTHASASDTKQLTVTYGPDEQRVKTIYSINSNTNRTKYFGLGSYEKEIAADNTIRELYYISTPTGVAAILEKTNNQTNLYYIHTDILGSFDAITNSSGTVLERLSFDPWGRRRNANDWTYTDVPESFLFDRGFTGHEHLDQFDLINMNGRVYDPLLAMFLSPDNYVQAPDFTQNFNRYTYCGNNPLKYTDPDGEFFWLPVIIGAVLFGTANTAIHNNNGDIHNFWDGLGYFVQGAVGGAVAGATWSLGIAGITSTNTLAQIGGWTIAASKGISAVSTITSSINNIENSGKILMGRAYTDEKSGFLGGIWQGISRNTWEAPQTWAGYNASQFYNSFWKVDNVSYFGGATLTNRHSSSGPGGMTLGNFICGENLSANTSDWTFMHEYGHTIQSRRWGPIYGLFIAPASGLDMLSGGNRRWLNEGYTVHDLRWYERQANRYAANYFGVSDESENPTKMPSYEIRHRERPSVLTLHP